MTRTFLFLIASFLTYPCFADPLETTAGDFYDAAKKRA